MLYTHIPTVSDHVVVSYPKAGYSCGITFSYYLTGGGGVTLSLRTSGGVVLWSASSPADDTPTWVGAGITSTRYLTSDVREGVEFVLTSSTAGGSGSVALDDVTINFCLPCDFNALESGFELSYSNYSKVYLRTPLAIQIQVLGTCVCV